MTHVEHGPSVPPVDPGPASRDGTISIRTLGGDAESFFDGASVVEGLTADPCVLPAKFYYDEVGSRLYEAQCQQPEYYLTRTETALLGRSVEAIAATAGPCEPVELGSGNARKTELLLTALAARGATTFTAIDVSRGIVEAAAHRLVDRIPGIAVNGIIATFEDGLAALAPTRRRRLFLLLGSTIGNLYDDELDRFMTALAGAASPGDRVLIGADLDKDSVMIEAAYNDANGVGSVINLNVLAHLNWRFGGDFDLGAWRHRARHDRPNHRVDAHLVSLRRQTVSLSALGLDRAFDRGDTILTEIMRKLPMTVLTDLFDRYGFGLMRSWLDDEIRYALALFERR